MDTQRLALIDDTLREGRARLRFYGFMFTKNCAFGLLFRDKLPVVPVRGVKP